jgi:glycosyltransferase involved in cell wall biosynthesis
VDGTNDPFLYYRAADVALCTSRIESAPRVIMDAMACGLPIITTPVFGIPEMVRENVNALFYAPGDIDALARLLTRVVEDGALRARLAASSRPLYDSMPSFDEMVERYGGAIRQAAPLRRLATDW